MASQFLPWLIAALVLYAVACDVRAYVIPNWISATIAGLALVQIVLLGLGWAAWPYLACGAAVLVVGFGLFVCNWLGAGDVKLLAALALWAGPSDLVGLIVWTALGGGGLAGVVLVKDRLRRRTAAGDGVNAGPVAALSPAGGAVAPGSANPAETGPAAGRRPLPYAAAIACGVVYLFVHGRGLVWPGI